MDFDLDRARRDTPGTATVAHFNNAGAALPPRQVTRAVVDHLELEATIGGYEAEAVAAPLVANTYAALATLINCAPDEIALLENASRAWDMAFYSLPLRPGDRILTGRSEYSANVVAMLQVARRTGAVIELIEDDATGTLDLADLERRLRTPAALVAVTQAPSQSGLLNPVAEVGRLARAAGVPYLLDACQAVGQLPVDVQQIGCDFLSGTGRKFLRAPRGTGFLYVRRERLAELDPATVDVGAAGWTSADTYQLRPGARRFETFEGSVAGRIGLGVAVDYALGWGLPAIADRIGSLAAGLRAGLAAIAGVTVHDRGRRLSGIVTFGVDGRSAVEVKQRLSERGINISIPSVGHYDVPLRGREQMLRASVHYYNDDAEIGRLLDAVGALTSTGTR